MEAIWKAARAGEYDALVVAMHHVRERGSVRLEQLWSDTDEDGHCILHHAARAFSPQSVACLVAAGASPQALTSVERMSPLHCAASVGDVCTVKILCELHSDPLAKDVSGATPLHYAVFSDSFDCAQYFATCHPQCIEITNAAGSTPLMCACRLGSVRMVALLLQFGSKPDVRDNIGDTAMHYALHCFECVPPTMVLRCHDEDISPVVCASLLALHGGSPTATNTHAVRACAHVSGAHVALLQYCGRPSADEEGAVVKDRLDPLRRLCAASVKDVRNTLNVSTTDAELVIDLSRRCVAYVLAPDCIPQSELRLYTVRRHFFGAFLVLMTGFYLGNLYRATVGAFCD